MTEITKSLFKLIVPVDKVHPKFEQLRTLDGYEPARRLLDEIYQDFHDPEGNFLEQFQTTGFNARYFELYLFAYFIRSGFLVDRKYPNPDFLVTAGGHTVAVEATTVNPSTSGELAKYGKSIRDLTPDELKEYARHELPIRFGSPLYSKLKKKYWQLEHCRDVPFVIAIEAFHDDDALWMSDSSLTNYLYGISMGAKWDRAGRLNISKTEIKDHTIGKKTIVSSFFSLPDAEHISAVLFTNSGTNAKFSRMGFQQGYGCDQTRLVRMGTCYNPDKDAMDPTLFSYDLDCPPFVEPWGQGIVVMHNPNCIHPLPDDFFFPGVRMYIDKDDILKSDFSGWHPFASDTLIQYMGEAKKELLGVLPWRSTIMVEAIPMEAFRKICGPQMLGSGPFGEEAGWFEDDTSSFLGVVIQDTTDKDWGYIVLARDEYFQIRAIDSLFEFSSRDLARVALQHKMADLLSKPQRVFPGGLAATQGQMGANENG